MNMDFEVISKQRYLTKAEYEFCVSVDAKFVSDAFFIGDYSIYGDYLNLRAYSEHDHDKRQYEIETGLPV